MKFSSVNIDKSIQAKRLIFKKEGSYIFDLVFQLIYTLAIVIFYIVIMLLEWDTMDRNAQHFVVIFSVFVLFIVYLFILKILENKLTTIHSIHQSSENVAIVLKYFKDNNIKIKSKSNNLVIGVDQYKNVEGSSIAYKTNFIVILFYQKEVQFTIFTERKKLNFPSVFGKYYLKRDLKNMLLKK